MEGPGVAEGWQGVGDGAEGEGLREGGGSRGRTPRSRGTGVGRGGGSLNDTQQIFPVCHLLPIPGLSLPLASYNRDRQPGESMPLLPCRLTTLILRQRHAFNTQPNLMTSRKYW